MSKHILLVGSKPDSNWIGKLRESLKPWGGVEIAAEGEGLNCIRQQPYDLVILDAAVIDDVMSLVENIHRESPTIPLVVVTNSPTWQRAKQLFTFGVSDYVRKSFDAGTLQSTFERILSKSSAS